MNSGYDQSEAVHDANTLPTPGILKGITGEAEPGTDAIFMAGAGEATEARTGGDAASASSSSSARGGATSSGIWVQHFQLSLYNRNIKF